MPTSAICALPREVEHFADRADLHQRVSLLTTFREQRRVQEHRGAAEPVGKLRGEVVDVGVVLALHPARQRHHRDVEGVVRREVRDDGAHRFPAGDRDHVAVADRFQELVGGGAADQLQVGVWVPGHRRRHHRLAEPGRLDQPALDIDQPLERALDGGLDHAELAPTPDQPVDFGGREVQSRGDVRLRHLLDEVQGQNRVDLTDRLEFVVVFSHRDVRAAWSNSGQSSPPRGG